MEKDWRSKTFMEAVDYLVQKNADNLGDITFIVGPEKEVIRSFSFILIASSPVFEILTERKVKREKLENQDSTFSLPDVIPSVFRHFISLLHREDLNGEYLKKLELTLDEILHLVYISKKYAVTKLVKACRDYLMLLTNGPEALKLYDSLIIKDCEENELEKAAFNYIKTNISHLLNTQDFVLLSKLTLNKILREQCLVVNELKLFEAVYRWAEFQCEQRGIEKTGGNIRGVLGHLLFLLRLPLISPRDFTLSVLSKHVLKKDEVLAIYMFITVSQEDRERLNMEELPFSTQQRSPKLNIATFFQGRDNPAFFPNKEMTHSNSICCDCRIAIYSFGFLAPINCDSTFTIEIKVKQAGEVKQIKSTKTVKERQNFTIEFETPIILEANNPYWIDYTIEGGSKTQSTVSEFSKPVELTINGVRFIYCSHNQVGQMHQITFAKI